MAALGKMAEDAVEAREEAIAGRTQASEGTACDTNSKEIKERRDRE